GQPAPEASKPAVQTAPPVAAKPAPVKAAPAPPAAQPTIWDELLANPMMVGLGGAAGLLVLLLGWASMRRRRMAMTEFQESILAAEQAGGLHAAADADGAVADSGDSGDGAAGESSLLSDFAVSDMDAIQSEGEADPLAEADVYLAYGRYQQAEELVSEALKNAPERNDLHMKLLEIYHAAQNATAFDGHAEAFLARLDSQEDPFWARVAEMGREISPDNPLYKSDSAGEAAEAVAPVMDMPETEDAAPVEDHSNELDAPELMAAVQDSGVAEPGAVDVQEPETAEAEEDNGLDFDLDFDLGEDVAAPAADTEADLADLEFELDDDASKAASDPDLSQMLDFNLETGSTADQQAGLESDPDSVSAASEGHASGEAAMLDDVGLDLDLGALPELGEADDVESGEVDEGEGLLSDVDEVGTKLDLARAYLDMGDPDGARSILEEVRQEGNGDQQEEARTLLSQLA
ncbi:MAG: FimV/HubP family polar landmark protein, partial [Gammaproteobacteria bacterium]